MPRKPQTKHGPGGKYYRKRLTIGGRTVDVYGKTLAELAEKVTLKENELAALANVPTKELYVFEYAAGWYARRAPHLSEDRRKLFQHQINKVICPVIGGKLIREVTLDDLEDVLATRAKLSHRSQQDTVQILKQIFAAACASDAIAKDPSLQLKAHGAKSKQRPALTEPQQEQLLAAVRGLSVETFVMLGLYTGMRRGEICGLRWDCVHLDGAAPHIDVRRSCRWPNHHRPEVSDKLKSTAAFRTIPLPPQLVQYLHGLYDALPGKAEAKLRRYVYANADGSAVSYSTLKRRWGTVKTRSTASGRKLGEKIRNHPVTVSLDFMPTPHQLRHSYITRLVLSGVDLKRVQYLAGHEDPEITLKIYTSLQKAAPEDLIDEIWAAFDAADSEE